ncbi:MAG: hypothetical protein SF187_20770 [Deltaproteobacteria bacterium]|nr:hypothetical protein [Deltaproteobacteria bacterium]
MTAFLPMLAYMRSAKFVVLGATVSAALVVACFGDTDKLFNVLAEQQSVQAGGTDAMVTLGKGRQRVELFIPADALATPRPLRVGLATGVARRGRAPLTDTAVLIEPQNTAFAVPVRTRQFVPPPPVGRVYRVVVVPDGENKFLVRGRARLVQAASANVEGYEQWEGDSSGSGLWGLALEEPGDEGIAVPTADAGALDAGTPTTICTPATAVGCTTGQACVLSCLASGNAATMCVPAGQKQPGEVCTGNAECAPGSQCYNRGCGISVCRRYCTQDAQCPMAGTCSNFVSCPNEPAAGARLCSQPCDPRGAAQQGCVTGLRCFVLPGEVTDCECVTPQRVGVDGGACTTTGDCGPGLICVNTGVPVCRPICRLDQPTTCQAGRSCQKLTNPDHAVFGACVP